MNVINLNSYKREKERQRLIKVKKSKALDRLLEAEPLGAYDYNHNFYKLVDLFMEEHYPDYAWKFDVWLTEIFETKE